MPSIEQLVMDMQFTVGTGGDFVTLNEALSYASTFQPIHKLGNPTITLQLLTGYVETEGIAVEGLSLAFVNITAVDNPVPASVTGNLFSCDNGRLPLISCRFDMQGTGGHGIFLEQSEIVVNAGGVINAGKSGLYSIAMGRFTLLDADFFHAQEYGAYINHGSRGEIGDTDFSQAGQRGGLSDELGLPFNGIHVRHSSHVNISGASDFRLDGVNNDPDDLRVMHGGIVDVASGAGSVGGFSQAPNALTANGIIFAS